MPNPKKLLVKNIFSNWVAMFVTLAISFFMSPFLVHTLGKEQYGIWALVLSVIAYSSFLDVGMKQSLARFIPKYYATKDFQSLNEILNSSSVIYKVSGTMVIPFTFLMAFFFIDSFNIPSELLDITRTVLIIIGLRQATFFYFTTRTAIGPFHRYDIANAIDIFFAISNALVIVLFLKLGYGLLALAIITMSTTLVKIIARSTAQRKIVPEIRYRLKYIKKVKVKELLNYGSISFLIVICWMVIFNSDNVIIGIFLTTTDITYFSIAAILVNYLRILISSIGTPLVPAISHLDATSDMKEIASMFYKITKYLYFICTGICLLILFYGDEFIYLWMGADFTTTVNILYILIIPACIYLPQMMANSVLLGISRHKSLFYILLTETLSKIILSLILLQFWGIYGVALGSVIPQLIIYIFIYPKTFNNIIEGNLKMFYLSSGKMILIALIYCLPVCVLISYFSPLTGWIGLVINVAVSGLPLIIVFWIQILDKYDRVRITERLPSKIRSFLIK
jgi:O-antigen/teichoic acid export membrane protein